MYEIFEQLLQRFGVTTADVCKATGIGQSTMSNWKNRRNLISGKNATLIADYFGVTVGYLMTGREDTENKEPQLKPRDEKDIKTILANTEQLLRQDGLMFEGRPVSQESIDSILSAMHIGMEMAKKKNKELYTPKKYKKD